MKKPETIEEKEKRHAAAYARIPSQPTEFDEWEPEQVWDEDEEGEPEEAIQPAAAPGGGKRSMERGDLEMQDTERIGTAIRDWIRQVGA